MGKDKRKHIICGAIAAVAVGLITYLMSGEDSGYSLAAGVWSALAGGFVAAAVKEYCDKDYCLDPTKWDWRDIGCTMIGAAVVAVDALLDAFAHEQGMVATNGAYALLFVSIGEFVLGCLEFGAQLFKLLDRLVPVFIRIRRTIALGVCDKFIKFLSSIAKQ